MGQKICLPPLGATTPGADTRPDLAVTEPARLVASLGEMAAFLRKRELELPMCFLHNEAISGSAVESLEQAIVLLGTANVRALSVSILWSRQLPYPVADEYWKRAFLVGTIARYWAYRRHGVDPEQAFLGGLLQQIGKLRRCLPTARCHNWVADGLRVARHLAFAPWAEEVIASASAHEFTGPNRALNLLVDLARCVAAWLSVSADSAEIPAWILSRYKDNDVLLPELRDLREPRDEAIRTWARFPLRATKGVDRQ